MFRLDGKTALVTGAGRNVGAGIATALAAQGAKVVVNDIDADQAAAMAAALPGARSAAFDVTDAPAGRDALDRIGPIDILVNNAGVPAGMHPGPLSGDADRGMGAVCRSESLRFVAHDQGRHRPDV